LNTINRNFLETEHVTVVVTEYSDYTAVKTIYLNDLNFKSKTEIFHANGVIEGSFELTDECVKGLTVSQEAWDKCFPPKPTTLWSKIKDSSSVLFRTLIGEK
jgi:hypothetical protein